MAYLMQQGRAVVLRGLVGINRYQGLAKFHTAIQAFFLQRTLDNLELLVAKVKLGGVAKLLNSHVR